jgi:hypothetical protein
LEVGSRFLAVFALSIHADYQCRHSGVCCSSDWDVPVELPIYRTLGSALSSQTLNPVGAPDGNGDILIVDAELPTDAAAMLARTATGDCVFFHRRSGLCVVHRDLGEHALPSTCRHFPRVSVRDRRGTFLTLTHYCPTAADLLFRNDVLLDIVRSPAAFPDVDYQGLSVDADAWPPLLHPAMLMDLDGYSAWERHMVQRCADGQLSPEAVVVALWRDAQTIRGWRPGHGTLAEAIRLLAARGSLPGESEGLAPRTLDPSLELHRAVATAIPDDLRPEPDEDWLPAVYAARVLPSWGDFQVPLRRYLAAKAFANWTAYQGRGILAIVRGLEAALAVVRVEAARQCRNAGRPLDAALLKEAIRSADFLLNHLAVGEELAAVWSRAEEEPSGIRAEHHISKIATTGP